MTRIDDDEKDPTETTAAYRRKLTFISILEFNFLRLFLILDDSKISTEGWYNQMMTIMKEDIIYTII